MGEHLPEQCWHTSLDKSGRVHLPAELRKELGVTAGVDLVWMKDSGGLKLRPFEEVIHEYQEYFLSLGPASESWSDELIRERREEARRE
jgi:AbrB family transcriptional regulator (stage V sporulation protein T)